MFPCENNLFIRLPRHGHRKQGTGDCRLIHNIAGTHTTNIIICGKKSETHAVLFFVERNNSFIISSSTNGMNWLSLHKHTKLNHKYTDLVETPQKVQ